MPDIIFYPKITESEYPYTDTAAVRQALDDCRELADLGVTDVCVTPWNPYQNNFSLQDKLDGIERFAGEIISQYG